MMNIRIFTVCACTAVAMLAGCETTKLPVTAAAAPVQSTAPVAPPPKAAPAAPAPAPQSKVEPVDTAKEAAARAAAAAAAAKALPAQRVVYFDFDSFVIKDDFKPLVDSFAKVLTVNPSQKLVIEGHTDERGGREYNLALGQKRAEAVVKSLTLLGADGQRLEAVSFGEERPAEQGSTETAWSKNRRAELKGR
jgi:peptidoglycan-associated lipoprotein